jgi:HTH-type transcriptional regulator, sugar sensing transcriptional regulator
MKEVYNLLEKIGLTTLESKVYIALLELQESQSGNLCKFTNIASSNIYNILDSLIKKGLVSYKVKNNIKTFMPASPDFLSEIFLQKEKRLEEERKELKNLITNLKKTEIKNESYSDYKYFEGISGIKSMWYEINNTMDNSSILKMHTAKVEGYKTLVGFYNEHHSLRLKKKIRERLIFPKEDRKLADKRRNKFTEIRFMDLENFAEWGIVNNSFYIQYATTKEPRGFLIKDPIFAKTFEQVFDSLWEKSKK